MSQHPPRSEWATLEPAKLYEVRSYLTGIYYNTYRSNPSLGKQYLALIDELSALIEHKTQPAPTS